MDLGIAGRNALITGGSRGLGRQCAISLGGEGVNVAICGRTESTINATVDDLTGLGVRACWDRRRRDANRRLAARSQRGG